VAITPVRGQNIEEHVATDLDRCNDENNQGCSSSRKSRSIIGKHDRWDGWRYHWRQRYQSL